MKNKILFSFMLIVALSAFSNTVDAAPYRGCHRGWCGPRPIARVWVPPVRFVVPEVVVPAYYPGYRGYYRPVPPPCRVVYRPHPRYWR